MERLDPVLFITDTHSPYHDARAYNLLETVVEKVSNKFKRVIIGGDFPDWYSVSSHSKDPSREETFLKEVETTKALLRRVESWGFKRMDYIMGNHEDRLDRYIHDKAPEMKGVVSTDGLLELTKHKWHVTPYRDHMEVGKCYVTHDVGKAGPTAVRDAMASYQDNIVINHLHRTIYMVEGNAKGVPHVAACFGWLGDRTKVDYMFKVKANRDWSLGFGVRYMKSDGTIFLQPATIVNYECVVEGKLFSARG